MKNLTLCLLIVAGLTATSCDDLLDVKSESSLGYNNFWENEDGAKAAQVALHANLRNYHNTLWTLGELRSDIWGGTTLSTPMDMDIVHQEISIGQVPSIMRNWSNFYSYINLANDVIKNAPDVTFSSTSAKEYLLGQAYGLRAFIYYKLLQNWGAVPLVLEPTAEIDFENLYIPRTPADQIMVQIKKDIQSSLDQFKDNNAFMNNRRIYWSKAATLTLKGDVYIWSGTHMAGGSADYTAARQALQQVIDMESFELLPNFNDVFAFTNKNNREIIFAMSYGIDQASTTFYRFTGSNGSLQTYYLRTGERPTHLLVNGGNQYGPSDELLGKWTDFDDSRNDGTFYRLYANPDATGYQASMLRKFWGTVRNGEKLDVDDVPIYRYADVILLMAEAKNLLNEDPSGEINQIRQRAYGANFPGHEYTNDTKENNTEAILDENLFEFIAEGKRWTDLRRAGDEWVYKFNKFLDPEDSHLLLLPITRDMIGRNPLLEQTPGYQF